MAYLTSGTRGRTFTDWYGTADREVQSLAGVSINDLADRDSRAAYDDGMTPGQYARRLLREEGF